MKTFFSTLVLLTLLALSGAAAANPTAQVTLQSHDLAGTRWTGPALNCATGPLATMTLSDPTLVRSLKAPPWTLRLAPLRTVLLGEILSPEAGREDGAGPSGVRNAKQDQSERFYTLGCWATDMVLAWKNGAVVFMAACAA